MRISLIPAFAAVLFVPAMMLAPAAASAENPPSVPNVSNPNAANTPDAATKTSDGKFVQDLGDRAIAQIADKSISQDERNQRYDQLLRDSFDIKSIAHFVAGRAFNNAPPEQQQEYMGLFEKLVVKTYGDRLNLYSGEGFHVVGVRPESDEDSIVSSEITHADGSSPARVDWRVRNKGGKPAVIDVSVEGVSQSVTQRDEYSSIIQRDGGKLDGLIDLMKKQVQEQQSQ